MPKTSKEQIDADEKKVMKLLQQNSGESIDNIAKKCGFSRQKVWRIKKRMEDNKSIWGYTAVADDEKLNKNRYIMLFKQTSEPLGDAINKIIDLTVSKKAEEIGIEILSGGLIHGFYDWVVIFRAKDIKNAKKLGEILLGTYPKLISEVEIMEYIFLLKQCGIVNPEIDKLKEFFI
jgi:DNA-binding Lrp family transcriptional regulator